MNINKAWIKIINDINSRNYSDFKYINSILSDNFKNLIFLGNKRNHNSINQYIYKKENSLVYLNDINNNLFKKNIKLNNLKEKYNMNINNNDNNNNKIFMIQNINNNINRNNISELKYLRLDKLIKDYNIDSKDNKKFNNSKMVQKYNKIVYVNNFIINKNKSILKQEKKVAKIKRSSKYRGVSKNGSGWQVLFMFNSNKLYIGTYNSEELAARIYDVVSIRKIGIKSKTNYLYNTEQIDRILKTNIDFKSNNISKIISELIV